MRRAAALYGRRGHSRAGQGRAEQDMICYDMSRYVVICHGRAGQSRTAPTRPRSAPAAPQPPQAPSPPRPAMPPAPQRPPPPASWRRRHRPAEAEPRRTRRSRRCRNSRRLCRGHGGLSPPQRRGRGPPAGARGWGFGSALPVPAGVWGCPAGGPLSPLCSRPPPLRPLWP